MIVSCSRRTDVPALYDPWLRGRLAAGHADVAHPYDARRVRRVDLRPAPEGDLEALVLWTRNPGPLLDALPAWEEKGLRTLWLVTLTAYPRALEPRSPEPAAAAEAVRRLAALVGRDRVAWRYDPVALAAAAGVNEGWHRQNFGRLAGALAGATSRCIVSLYDDYARARRRLEAAGVCCEAPPAALLGDLAAEAGRHGIEVQTCCEEAAKTGIRSGACIDGELLGRLWGLPDRGRDAGQRAGCRCAPSVDIGAYDTCVHGCLYCYATGAPGAAARRRAGHRPEGERLV